MLHRYLIIICLLAPLMAFADETENRLISFLDSREVMEQVYFEPSSSKLSPVARKQLDAVIPRIRKADTASALFRVEGFAGPADQSQSDVGLSMYRALAVRNYLRERHGLNVEVFLTGFGTINPSGGEQESRRVDITLYQKPVEFSALFENQENVEKIIVR
jgi:outer membrane protein OmpA-like peptidoglycan-associated protein